MTDPSMTSPSMPVLPVPALPTDPFDTRAVTASAARPHVGSAFTLWAGPEPVALTLDAVDGSDDSFALVFRTPAVLSQATYPVEHAVLGRLALFLVPVGRDAGGALYEAVFNRTPA